MSPLRAGATSVDAQEPIGVGHGRVGPDAAARCSSYRPFVSTGPVLTYVSSVDDPQSERMAKVVRDVVRENRATGVELNLLDVDAESAHIRTLGVIRSPALILHCDGVERGRLVGAQSHRAVLHMLLPELHRDPNDAVVELRRQLEAPGEQFPRRVLKRHERIGKAARVEMLARVPLFATMAKKQLAEVGAAADELVVDAGSTLMREDEPGDAFFVVADGSMDVRRRRRLVATIGPGDFVGEMSLLDGGSRTATVTATERCVLLVLDRSTFTAMLQGSPSLAISMLEVLSTRLRQADASLTD